GPVMARARERAPGVEARAGRFPGPSLIPALHAIQERVGWLPREELVALSRDVRRPLYEIEGLISFYPHFRTRPPATVEVHACHDLSCWLQGADRRIAELRERYAGDAEVEVTEVSCLGRCDVAPAVAVNEVPAAATADLDAVIGAARHRGGTEGRPPGQQGQGPVTEERGVAPAGGSRGVAPPGQQGQGPVTEERGVAPAGGSRGGAPPGQQGQQRQRQPNDPYAAAGGRAPGVPGGHSAGAKGARPRGGRRGALRGGGVPGGSPPRANRASSASGSRTTLMQRRGNGTGCCARSCPGSWTPGGSPRRCRTRGCAGWAGRGSPPGGSGSWSRRRAPGRSTRSATPTSPSRARSRTGRSSPSSRTWCWRGCCWGWSRSAPRKAGCSSGTSTAPRKR